MIVTEAILGDQVEFVNIDTKMPCHVNADVLIGCCALGNRILVMAGSGNDVFAVRVSVRGGKLSRETLCVTALAVEGSVGWTGFPFLCRISESRAFLHFSNNAHMWYCDLVGERVIAKRLAALMPPKWSFFNLPIPISDGKTLVAGAWPPSTNILLLSHGDTLQSKRVGSIPGGARRSVSTVLLKDRFVVGFGGFNWDRFDDMWILDLQTSGCSRVRAKGKWHPKDDLVALAVTGDALYLLGGWATKSAYSISIISFSRLIRDWRVKLAFCSSMGLPQAINSFYSRRMCANYIPCFL